MTIFSPPANGVDFSVTPPATVTFSEGADNGDTECLSILIIDDDDFENYHMFQAQLLAVEPASVPIMLNNTLSTVLIQDDGEKNSHIILL